jgi:hypothetical protein
VASGKQFYLYVLQTIDRADAEIGGSEKPFTGNTPTTAGPATFQPPLTLIKP